MSYLEIIGSVLKLILLFVSSNNSSNESDKKQKLLAAKMITEGLMTRDKKRVTTGFDRLRKLVIFLGFTSIFLVSGCRTNLHPVYDTDLFFIEKGAVVTHVDGVKSVVPEDGVYMSNWYVENVVDVKVKK